MHQPYYATDGRRLPPFDHRLWCSYTDARPETDAVPVLLETATLLRCPLPLTLNSPSLDSIHNPTSTTFKGYVTTLPNHLGTGFTPSRN
jgi:hypothetical protein